MLKKYKTELGAFIVAAIVFLLIDISGIQAYVFVKGDIVNKLAVKIFQLMFLFSIFRTMGYMVKERKTKAGKHWICISVLYFLVVAFVQVLVWPGLWSQDDISLLIGAQTYEIGSWQHCMSQMFANVCLQTIPFAGGMILLQILIAALIVGWCASKVVFSFADAGENPFSNKKIIIMEALLIVPALLPPVIEYILTGFRMGVYSFVELLLIVKLFLHFRNSGKLSISELIDIILLTTIVAAWRSEAIYYVVCIPILLFLLGKNKVSRARIAVVFVISTVLVLGIGKIDKFLWGDDTKYSISATLLALPEVVCAADAEEDADELAAIGEVIDVRYIYEFPDCSGEDLFWIDGFIEEHTKEEFDAYRRAYIKLVIKYWDVTLPRMGRMFLACCGLRGYDGYTMQRTVVNSVGKAQTLMDIYSESGSSWYKLGGIFKESFFPELRVDVIYAIACCQEDEKVTLPYYFFWNMLIPIVLASVLAVIFLFRRKWFMLFLALTVLGRVPLIFITSPASYAMYYLSVYLVGYFLFIACSMEWIVNKRTKET